MSEKMTLTRKVSGRVFTVELPAEREEETGQLAVHIDVAQAGELAIAAALALEGPADGASFRFMRTTLGLRATELAGWLDVRAETLSSWRPPSATSTAPPGLRWGRWFSSASAVRRTSRCGCSAWSTG